MNEACCRNLGPLFYFIHLCSSFLGRRGREGGTPSILRLGISQPDGQSKNNLLSLPLSLLLSLRPKMSSFSNLVSDGRDGAVLGVCSATAPASTSTRQLSSSDKKSGRRTNGREEESAAARFPRLTNRSLSLPRSPIRLYLSTFRRRPQFMVRHRGEERRPSIE